MDKKKVKTELLIHDLKNPLAVIETGINLLIRNSDKYGPLTEKQNRVLCRTLRNAKIAMALVNDIMEIGRSKEGIISKEPCRCLDIIRFPLVELFDLIKWKPYPLPALDGCIDPAISDNNIVCRTGSYPYWPEIIHYSIDEEIASILSPAEPATPQD